MLPLEAVAELKIELHIEGAVECWSLASAIRELSPLTQSVSSFSLSRLSRCTLRLAECARNKL